MPDTNKHVFLLSKHLFVAGFSSIPSERFDCRVWQLLAGSEMIFRTWQ